MSQTDTGNAALFLALGGDRFQPTDLARGGWSDDAQHGSPPSGLLARAIEHAPSSFPMQVVRITMDLFRAVPMTPVDVETTILRDGRRIQVVESILSSDGVEVGRATGLKIRVTELDLPPSALEHGEPLPPPDVAEPASWETVLGRPLRTTRFHSHAIDIRTVDGSFFALGTGVSWFRLRRPVVAGEVPTPFVRLATLADMSNGNSQRIDPRQWLYVNPDITLYLHRLPVSEWIGMRSTAHQHPTGIGLADTTVFDVDGPLGRINQAQLLDRRAHLGTSDG